MMDGISLTNKMTIVVEMRDEQKETKNWKEENNYKEKEFNKKKPNSEDQLYVSWVM